MDALKILIEARQKIKDPQAWGRGRRSWDRPRDTFCAAEAIESRRNGERYERSRAFRMLGYAAGLDHTTNITTWNDNSTHSEVLAAFNLAIAILRMG